MQPNTAYQVYFYPNGNTGVTDGKQQIVELQEAWAVLFAQFLESKGYDPTAFELFFPNATGRYFRTSEGEWNWTVE